MMTDMAKVALALETSRLVTVYCSSSHCSSCPVQAAESVVLELIKKEESRNALFSLCNAASASNSP